MTRIFQTCVAPGSSAIYIEGSCWVKSLKEGRWDIFDSVCDSVCCRHHALGR